MENTELQTVSIFRSWVELASELPSDTERGRFYHAICCYSLYGTEPELSGKLKLFFNLLRANIEKSNKRKAAQLLGAQKRKENKKTEKPKDCLQNDLQNDLQNGSSSKVIVLQKASSTDEKPITNDTENCYEREREGERGKEKGNNKLLPQKKSVSFAVYLPDSLQVPEVIEKWQEWEKYRRSKRKPISEAAAKKQIASISELTPLDVISAIDYSIANDYQGLFIPSPAKDRALSKRAAATMKDYTGI